MSDLQERIERAIAKALSRHVGNGTYMDAAASVIEDLGLTEEYSISAHGVMLMGATDSIDEARSWAQETAGRAAVVSHVVSGWREA